MGQVSLEPKNLRERCEGAGDAGRLGRPLRAAHEQQAWPRREEDLVPIVAISYSWRLHLEEQIGT